MQPVSDGSVKSAFSFESYKIDDISFEMKKYVELLEYTGNFDSNAWVPHVEIGKPVYLVKEQKYISSLEVKLQLMPYKEEEKKEEVPEPLLNCELHISGLFSVEKGRLTEEVEKNLVKIQLPALLMPYARGVLTSILSNAGFGTVILPLININELARQVEGELEIQLLTTD